MTSGIATFLLATVAHMAAQPPISVRWQMGRNEYGPKAQYTSQLIIKNVSSQSLGANWDFFFNQLPRQISVPAECPVDVKEVYTTYYRIHPNERYKPLPAGDSLVVPLTTSGTLVNRCDWPMGGHLVLDGQTRNPIAVDIVHDELAHREQVSNHRDYPDGEWVYRYNEELQGIMAVEKSWLWQSIFPTPRKIGKSPWDGVAETLNSLRPKPDYKAGANNLTTRKQFYIQTHWYSNYLKAAEYLRRELLKRGYTEDKTENLASCGIAFMNFARSKGDLPIMDALGKDDAPYAKDEDPTAAEWYCMDVEAYNGILILADAEAGAMNGVKTLIAAVDASGGAPLPTAKIYDRPSFAYRGMHFDVARNFTSYDNLKRLIDLLAYYKLNKLQLHLTDDEGWRIEIPGLPELTEVGARRGCTLDELKDGFLAQTFDGNGLPDDTTQSANGYYTCEQFVNLLRYAADRGVSIIPEIDVPGHSRAAIVAMRYRYRKYIHNNPQEALRYVLWDDDDTSQYTSAQGYHDNVMNVASEGAYNFMYKVIDELDRMYREAGLKLECLHLGGDEVPAHCWDKAPQVQKLMKKEKLRTNDDVTAYFIRRLSDYTTHCGFRIGGWQEVALLNDETYKQLMRPRFYGVNVWQTVGNADTIAYAAANAGYPVILSNVGNFYMDMAYSRHQYEQGLYWGGTVDEFDSYNAQPWNIYASRFRLTQSGGQVSRTTGLTPLNDKRSIVGVQGQLWAETIRNFDQVQQILLPKMLGLVERSWNATPEWESLSEEQHKRRLFVYKERVDNQLDILRHMGYRTHLRPPGIKVEGKKVFFNKSSRGTIRYTFDGSDPTVQSAYEGYEPVSIPEGTTVIKAKLFDNNESSVTTYWWP